MRFLKPNTTQRINVLCLVITLLSLHTFAQRKKLGGACNRESWSTTRGNVFELYQTPGENGCATVYQNGKAKEVDGTWSSLSRNGNILIRESKRKSPSVNDNISYDISLSKMDGNTFHGGYGWSQKATGAVDSTVEWYIVQGYNKKSNPTSGMTNTGETYIIDGGTYEVWYKDVFGAPSVYNNNDNFTQIKCVRNKSVAKNSKRTLTTSRHIQEMIKHTKISTIGTLFEVSYKVEGFGNTSAADFTLDASFPRNSNKSQSTIAKTEAVQKAINVFPNPATDRFSLKLNGIANAQVMITDLLGKVIYNKAVTNSHLELRKGNTFTSGLYLIAVTDEFQNTYHTKLILK
jgi:hypothetical protein